jgi:hypothetical protein
VTASQVPRPCAGSLEGFFRKRPEMSIENDQDCVPGAPASRAECLPADLIIDYGLNDLNMATRQRVDNHIATCSDCAREIHAWQAAIRTKFGPSTRSTPPGRAE